MPIVHYNNEPLLFAIRHYVVQLKESWKLVYILMSTLIFRMSDGDFLLDDHEMTYGDDNKEKRWV